jgi:hypothetical protein
VVGTVAALGLFLPSIDKVWGAAPHDENTRERLRMGEVVYLGSTLAVTLLAAYAQGNLAPLYMGFGLALVIVAVQEHSLRHRQA